MKFLRLSLGVTVVVLLLLAVKVAQNSPYYATDATLRPHHEAHAALRSSGDFGLACGLAGSALILLNLTYLLRKRFAHRPWLGNLRMWMGMHVATGIVGCSLIAVHSSFLVRSAPGMLAISCLGIVVLTGLIGRYFYKLVPRSLAGRELKRTDLRLRIEEHRAALATRGLDLPALDEEPGADVSARRSFVSLLLGVLAGNRAMRNHERALREQILANPTLRVHAVEVLPLARQYCRDAQWLSRYADLRSLMGSWRFLHRWLAIVMVIVTLLHVAIALRYGDLRMPTGGLR